ncbi:putative uncharacterized protein DDB_G0274435 isoform X1 [Eleginops maclovinus]|uniref:putative uncharacterized protein DDB_G0274435 isoform X1 n=1 Tax=Eleginops maclovinus TaxID=56733 RepID=UPI003080684B
MSVPFSNTHLRVPRGFGTILEGLAREVLRDQPEDIPKYAAHYFDALLKQRDESGIDPAEWAAKLEDRFYNNHAFRASKPSPEKEPSAKMTISKEKSYESQTEDESNHTEDSNVSTTHPTLSEEVDLSESMEEYEEKQGITEKHVVSIEEGLSEEESVNMLPAADLQPDDLSGTEEERDQTITTFDQVDRAANGKDSFTVADQDNARSELEPTDLLSLKAISNVDGCAQELKLENECGDDEPKTSFVDMEIVDSEGDENNDGEEAVEVLSYPGLADVDVCATELGGTERSMEGANAENDEDSSKSQPEEKTVQSVLSQSETPEHNQQEEEDQVEKTEEEASSSESFSDVIHERLTHIEADLVCNDMPNEDSLVEINFEDVPKGQQIKEVEEKQPEEDSSVDVLQTRFLEMQQEEECKTAVETESNISHKQDHDEPAMMGVEKEVKSEGEEMERDHKKSDIMNKNLDTNDSHLNNSDIDGNREGVKTIGSSHQPTIDEANSEDEMDHKNEGNNKEGEINRNEFHQNEGWEKDEKSNNAEDETTDTVGRQ